MGLKTRGPVSVHTSHCTSEDQALSTASCFSALFSSCRFCLVRSSVMDILLLARVLRLLMTLSRIVRLTNRTIIALGFGSSGLSLSGKPTLWAASILQWEKLFRPENCEFFEFFFSLTLRFFFQSEFFLIKKIYAHIFFIFTTIICHNEVFLSLNCYLLHC